MDISIICCPYSLCKRQKSSAVHDRLDRPSPRSARLVALFLQKTSGNLFAFFIFSIKIVSSFALLLSIIMGLSQGTPSEIE